MEKNGLLELIKEISQAAVNLPKNEAKKESVSFKEKTASNTNVEPKKIDRNKKSAPSTHAIIQMIQTHNALSREIAENKQKN